MFYALCLKFYRSCNRGLFKKARDSLDLIRLAFVASKKYEVPQNSEKIWTHSSSRSSKVIDLGAHVQLP